MKCVAPPLLAALVLAAPAAFAQSGEPPPPLPPPTPPLVTRTPEPGPGEAPAPAAAKPAEAPPAADKAHKDERADDKGRDKEDKKDEREEKKGHAGPRPVPPPHEGFQLALRTGVSVPMGKLSAGKAMYDTFSPQVPLTIDLGFKPVSHLFLGVYLGVAVGGVNNRLADQCDRTNAECATASFFLGLEAHYHFAPAHRIDPWIGYGLGFEGGGVGNTVSGTTTTTTFTGFDFARLSGGFDVRISRVIGIGPMLDVNLGRYNHTTVKLERTTITDEDIADKRVHGWLTIGARLVFFP